MTKPKKPSSAFDWFPFYVFDWLLSQQVLRCSLTEEGAYVRLLAIQWKDGSVPSDVEHACVLSRARTEDETRAVASVLEKFFTLEESGSKRNERLESIRSEQIKKHRALSEAGKNGGILKGRKFSQARARLEPPLSQALAGPAMATLKPGSSNKNQNQNQKEEKEEKERKPRTPAEPAILPFLVDQALGFLAEAGRFTQTRASTPQSINLVRLIKLYPDPDTWRLAGQWLAAGGESWKSELDVRSMGCFDQWVAHSRKWDAEGRLPVTKGTTSADTKTNFQPPMAAVKETRELKL